MTNHFNRKCRLENLEQRQMMAADLAGVAALQATPAGAEADWFIADSFSFGVEREMKEGTTQSGKTSAEVPAPQAMIFVHIPSMGDKSIRPQVEESPSLTAASLVVGESLQSGHFQSLDGLDSEMDVASDSQPVSYMKYKLDRCFIKSWSTSGDADDRPTEAIDLAFASLGEDAVNGNSPGTSDFYFRGDESPTEEVAYYYNKIALGYARTADGKNW